MPDESKQPRSNFDQRHIQVGGNQYNAARDINLIPDPSDRHLLREWWHKVLREHGRYACYGIFLLLPSDKETIRYLTEYSKELDLISGEHCLVTTLGSTDFRLPGFDAKAWNYQVQEQATEGYSMKVARIFDISIERFPCLLLFQDIRSSSHVAITLAGLTAEDIATRMRSIFALIGVTRATDTKTSISASYV